MGDRTARPKAERVGEGKEFSFSFYFQSFEIQFSKAVEILF
jgi:hypothetical protein